MKEFLNILLFIWQLPQTIIGWIVSVFYKCTHVVKYKGTGIRVCPSFPGGISLGKVIIVKKYPNNTTAWNTAKHEYGHSIQSKYLGWFYLFVIGIPSILWAAWWNPNRNVSYYNFYTEKWADRLGNVQR